MQKTTRSTPSRFSWRNWCATKGSPATSTIDLGMVWVMGRSRVARPPARMATGSIG